MKSPENLISISDERRILNEISAKILNEDKMHKIAQARETSKHPVYFAEMLFHCECDDQACAQLIAVSTEEYAQSHSHIMQFIVIPEHVRPDIEKVIENFSNYALVKKFFPHTAPA